MSLEARIFAQNRFSVISPILKRTFVVERAETTRLLLAVRLLSTAIGTAADGLV